MNPYKRIIKNRESVKWRAMIRKAHKTDPTGVLPSAMSVLLEATKGMREELDIVLISMKRCCSCAGLMSAYEEKSNGGACNECMDKAYSQAMIDEGGPEDQK